MLKNNRGFSLIEVLVTVGLIGILVSIAIPSYNKYKKNTMKMAIKADVGNGHKAYSAHDATNGDFCATLDEVGMNVVMTSATYRKQGFYGFGAINTDCGGTPSDLKAVKFQNDGYCYDSSTRQPDSTSMATCNTGTLSWKTDNEFGGTTTACKVGADTFDLGAYSNTSSLNTFIVINEGGKVDEVTGNTCSVVP